MQVHGAKLRGNACIEEIDYRAARGLDKSVIRALTQESLLAMPGFILWLPGAQGLGQVVPEFEKPVIQHRQPAADITRAADVGGNEILPGGTLTARRCRLIGNHVPEIGQGSDNAVVPPAGVLSGVTDNERFP